MTRISPFHLRRGDLIVDQACRVVRIIGARGGQLVIQVTDETGGSPYTLGLPVDLPVDVDCVA